MRRGRRGPAARTLATGVVLALAGALAACGGGEDDGEGGEGGGAESITVWIQEDLPDRVAATQEIIDQFSSESGVEVELVSVGEDQFNQLITSAAAAGDLPDVIGGISLPQVRTLSANELLDTESVGEVMESLDPSTFSERAIELTADGDTQLAVPSESWLQLLFYRKDLFEEAGLEAPTTYESILAAAEALHKEGMAGFVGANAPGDAFTEQTFEHVALGNGCELVDEEGEVLLDSPECVEAFEFYGTLVEDYSVPGAQDVDTTRASYFAGQAAMLIWSTFVLDEMAGLRNDAKPNCPECKDDPAFLAKNTGVTTTIQGPSSEEPAIFGEVTSWTIMTDASADSSKQVVEYMLNDGYVDWIAIAPEGKVPVRTGTPDNPTEFSDEWGTLPAGVDTKAPLSDFYPADILEILAQGPTDVSRWAIPQGQGDLLGATQGEHPVATAVNEVTTGTPAEEAAGKAAEAVRSIADTMP
ncbi:bicyclomycin resistance protein [Nocardioides gansuensis]|uniref:Bicyclomycin resistance protein n=1 Tax=Nocardioides gansuensis TaxID=2138300 RepID=A0A2T8FEE2_9ACTN|nr:extracellular solute-binding protein [Nocardioides gansuensis]PVG84060.1 bicyclomycin resistance protein [Nocardioides gansuensis]